MRNILDPLDIEWRHATHMTLTSESHFVCRDERYGIQWEQITKRDGHGKIGTPKNYYFIDGISREFTDVQEMCDCWNEFKNFDDPKSQIDYVKVIKPK